MSTPFRWFEQFRFVKTITRILDRVRDRTEQDDGFVDGVLSLTYDRAPSTITPRGFALLVAGFLIFKGAVIAHLGAETYVAAIQLLENGALVEQAGAFIMRPDVVSQVIANQLTALLA